ncbi:Type III flagellar switch regulator (C-ring) FliN C-term [Vibrio xiamenensis]|uniref:Type III flagellar switch regulator (C-ring) FliN C-term n=1 Tax=Vibrio xiamenensis TaxID=861298 RepID=A0A1G7Y1I2_9VIBR|nr:FliM/FliN family flagellar motor C-terminal domain-containing protein [Vibrio xiamenensis]SDG90244.1 Type III flagellar switch regulator (C-ring) FliN C-term [Vibrio xiamenensis]
MPKPNPTSDQPKHELQALNVELLGKPINVIREKLEAIMMDMCHGLTHELQTWLKTDQVNVTLQQINLHMLSPNELAKNKTSTLRHKAGGRVYVYTDSALLLKLSDRFYGAALDRSDVPLTSSDFRFQERIGKHISAWIAPETMWQITHFEPSHGVGIKAVLGVMLHDMDYQFHIELDSVLVHTLIEELELQPRKDLGKIFHKSLSATPVKLNVLLSKKTLALSDVLALRPNDILPIELLARAPVSIGSQHLFSGRVADQDGQLVLIFNDDKDSQ